METSRLFPLWVIVAVLCKKIKKRPKIDYETDEWTNLFLSGISKASPSDWLCDTEFAISGEKGGGYGQG